MGPLSPGYQGYSIDLGVNLCSIFSPIVRAYYNIYLKVYQWCGNVFICFSSLTMPVVTKKLMVFGDSHVKKMSDRSNYVDFFGVPGLNATSWSKYLNILEQYKIIVFQMGGNDLSIHPKRVKDPVESIGDTRKVLKEVMDWCKETGRIGLIMRIISRKSDETAISMLNKRLKRTFKHFILPDLPPSNLASDNVHLRQGDTILWESLLKNSHKSSWKGVIVLSDVAFLNDVLFCYFDSFALVYSLS